MSRRQIKVAVRYIWRERGATNLDGRHVVRPVLMGCTLGVPVDDSLDDPRLSGHSPDPIPYPKVLDGNLARVGEDFRPSEEAPIGGSSGGSRASGPSPSARGVAHAAGTCGLGGSNGRGDDRRGNDTRHCDYISACSPIVGRAFGHGCLHMVFCTPPPSLSIPEIPRSLRGSAESLTLSRLQFRLQSHPFSLTPGRLPLVIRRPQLSRAFPHCRHLAMESFP
jgi:hypothetical protein